MKESTPFEKAGYNPTDVFRTKAGNVIVLEEDDGSKWPLFRDVHSGETIYEVLYELERIHVGTCEWPVEYPPGSLFKDDGGDVYLLCRRWARENKAELQLFSIETGNRWSDEPISAPFTDKDLPESFEYLSNHVLEVGVE